MGKKFNGDIYRKTLLSALEKKTSNVVSDVVKKDIAPDLQHDVWFMIKEEIYDSYTPKLYERRGKTNGMLDINHIVVICDGCKLKIKNVANPSPSIFGTPITSNPMLIDWIDEGLIARLPNVRFQPWIRDRKGVKKRIVRDIIIDGILVSKVANGLRRELKADVKMK